VAGPLLREGLGEEVARRCSVEGVAVVGRAGDQAGAVAAARGVHQLAKRQRRLLAARCGGGSLRAPVTSACRGASLIRTILTASLGAGQVSGHRMIDVISCDDQRPYRLQHRRDAP